MLTKVMKLNIPKILYKQFWGRVLHPIIYDFYPRFYWEQRHKIHELGAVGALGRDESYNREIYRRKRDTLKLILDTLGIAKEGDKVLDVGCGIGLMQEVYVRRGCNVLGIDFSANAIRKARELYPTFKFRQKTIEEIEETGFDIVNCLEVTMHITNDKKWESTLNHLKNKLKPGGYLILSDELSIEATERHGYYIKNRGLKEYLRVLHELEFLSLTPYPAHPYSVAVFRKRL